MTTVKRNKAATLSRSVQRQAPPSDTGDPRRFATPLEQRRCDVLSRHVARLAGEHKLVRDLRELLFGGPTHTVSIDRALALLDSPATHYLGPDWFRSKAIPFAQHEATESSHTRITGIGEQSERRVRIKVKWPSGELSTDSEVLVFDRQGRSAIQRLEAPGHFGARTLVVFRDTWLELIKIYCAQFCSDLLWSEAEAVGFVMTGFRPEIRPVHAESAIARDLEGQPLRTEVTIRVQPFVSIDSVERILAAVRLALGRRLRPGPAMAHRTLALFEFVEERRAGEGWKVCPWTELVAAWDQEHRRDKWGYGGDRRNFRRDYERARHLLFEDYLPPREFHELQAKGEESKRPSKKPRR